jgi:hypothetical protein
MTRRRFFTGWQLAIILALLLFAATVLFTEWSEWSEWSEAWSLWGPDSHVRSELSASELTQKAREMDDSSRLIRAAEDLADETTLTLPSGSTEEE